MERTRLYWRRSGDTHHWQLLPWMPPKSGPNLPETKPIASKWIYAFQTGYVGSPAIATLSREIWVDPKGKLSFVDGEKRRHVEPDAAPKPTPADGVPFALSVQRDHLYYVFIVTRGRLFRDAITSIERLLAGTPGGGLTLKCMFTPQSPHAQGNTGPIQAIAVDPLTILESLGKDYQRLRNVAMNFSVPNGKDPDFKKVQLDVARYQLAKLIDKSLLRGDHDPEGVRKGLVNEGDWMRSQIIEPHERKIAQLNAVSEDAARALVAYLKSDLWDMVSDWYGVGPAGPKNSAAPEIGHFAKDAEAAAIQRLLETQTGQSFLRDYLLDPNGPRSWFFAPEDKNDEPAIKKLQDWYPVFRRGAMAGTLFWAELMPALIVLRMSKHPRQVMERTFEIYFKVTEMERVTATAYGIISERLALAQPTAVYERVNYKLVKQDVSEWFEHGQPKWPEGTTKRALGDLVEHVFIGVEVANLALKLQDLLEQALGQNSDDKASRRIVVLKAIAGALDLAVASQEPIREWAHGLKHAKIVATLAEESGHAAHGAAHGAAAAAEHDASVIAKITSPTAFKILGVLPALIDLVVHSLELEEALQESQTGVAIGHGVIILGSLMSAVGSAGAASGIEAGGALVALTASSLGLLVVGTLVMMLGYIIVDEFEKSEWRLFAENCIYGHKSPWPKLYPDNAAKQVGDKEAKGPERGHATWSAGGFSRWTGDLEGVQLQSRVLSALLCSLRIMGTSFGGSCAVRFGFGAIPPGAILQVQFSLNFTDGRTINPGYMIDLNNGGKIVNTWGALGHGHSKPYGEDGLTGLEFRPDYPDNVKIETASCAAVINYGKHNDDDPDVATGTVPIRGQLVYVILRGGRRPANTQEVSSLKMETAEGKPE